MKKSIAIFLLLTMLAVMLCACGEETYRCAACLEEVTQKPRIAAILGKEYQVCDSCVKRLEVLGADIK